MKHQLRSTGVSKRGIVYRKHWNLTRKPFSTAYESELIYFREPFAEAYHTLTLASHLAPANLWVVGDKGVGKTTLLRKLEDTLGDEMRFILLSGKYLNERSALLDSLERSGAFVAGSSSLSLETRLTEHFRRSGSNAGAALIAIDDADVIHDEDALDDLRRLQDLGISNDWPLITLFTGKSIPKQLRPGKSVRFNEVNLAHPTRNECGKILEHRLAASGSTATIFTPSALERLVSRAHGNIYTLLTMAELCLQVGSVAKIQTIDDELVRGRVEPYLERFFKEEAEVPKTAQQISKATTNEPLSGIQNGAETMVTTKPGGAIDAKSETISTGTGAATVRVSPMTMSPQRLVSQAELESYRASSVSENQRNNIQELARKIARGEFDVTKSLKQDEAVKAAEDAASVKAGAVEGKPATVEELNYEELYHAGVATLKQILDNLREKRFTDLKPVENLAEAVVKSTDDSYDLLRAALDQEDSSELHTHLMNVGVLSAVVAKELKLAPERRPELVQIAMVHDVGHLHCGEELLLSENRFDRKDFKAIKQHPIVGRDLIKKFTNGSELMADVIAQEHERDDGLGYPNYLDASGIHLYAKIIGVCDVFEALSHSRAHRRALTPEEAIVNMNATMLKRTDPRIVRALHRTVLLAISG